MSKRMIVPFLDLNAHHSPRRAEFTRAIEEVIDSGAFAGGPFVEQFEKEFAAYCDSAHCIGLGSGTEALWLSLLAAGIKAGDEVITVPNTFMATAEAITYCGARPVFVDVDDKTYTMDPARLEKAITSRTKAIIPVHLFGQIADMDAILEIAAEHGIPVIEDAAQAHGAEYKGRKAGTFGLAACFSFYPGKNLGAFGEAGAVVTQDEEMLEKIRILRDHGQISKYRHTAVGWNCRMDGIQAAVLRVKLPHLESGNLSRRVHAQRYNEALQDVAEIITPVEAPYARHVYHVYAIRVRDRDAVMSQLQENGIGCGIHYPVPVHLQEAYQSLRLKKEAFPVSERMAREFISLPMFPELTEEQIDCVALNVREAVSADDQAPLHAIA